MSTQDPLALPSSVGAPLERPERTHDLSRETGISHTTLYKWRKYVTSNLHLEQRSPQLKSAEEKWRLITQAYELEGQEPGVFLPLQVMTLFFKEHL